MATQNEEGSTQAVGIWLDRGPDNNRLLCGLPRSLAKKLGSNPWCTIRAYSNDGHECSLEGQDGTVICSL